MHILDNHNIVRITNATVKLFDNGIELAQLQHQGNGIYTSPLYPVAGRTYTVIASAPDFEEVTAVCPIPIATGIVQIDTAILKDEYDYPFLNLQVHFNDPESVENYYMLQAYQKYAYEEYDPYGFVVDTLYQNEDTVIVDTTWGIYTTRLAYEPLYLNSSDLIAEEVSTGTNAIVFSDALIDGKPYSFKAYAYVYVYTTDDEITMYLYLKSISKDLYLYYKTLAAHYNASGDPFAEPVFVYSNVENGMGVLGGYSYAIDSIKLNPEDFQGGWYYMEK